jgi:SPP1 family predicted phage head-tail adaptor
MGGQTDTWSTEGTVWASIWPVSAVELIRAGSTTMVGTHRVRIRHYDGLLASWRVKFGTRYFSITSIADFEERGREIELLCREIMA